MKRAADSNIEERHRNELRAAARRLFGQAGEWTDSAQALETLAIRTARVVPRFKGESAGNWLKRGLLDVLEKWAKD